VASEPLTEALQESVLAVLAFNAQHGALVAAQVQPEHFSGVYHEIAAPVIEYRRKFGKPPGAAHLEQLFSRAKLDPSDRKTHLLRRTLVNLSAQAEAVNAEYVVSRTQDFVRAQQLKTALLEANERYLQGGEEAVSEVEGILNNALRFRQHTLDAGTFLKDVEKSSVFQEREEGNITLNIPELDHLGIGPVAKRQLLYIAPKNCLVEDTLIDCPRNLTDYPQGIPIKDLVGKQFWTYSWDFEKDRPCLSWVSEVWKVGRAPVYRIRLDAKLRQKTGRRGGGTVRAKYLPPLELVGTYEHLVLLSDGTWRKLGELKPGDSLKSLYRRSSGKPAFAYSNISWTGSPSLGEGEHRFICEQLYGPPREGDFAHHKDHNRNNSNTDNLEWMEAREHASYHLGERNKEGTAGWRITGIHPKGMKGKNHSKKVRRKISKACSEVAKKRLRNEKGHFIQNHGVVSIEKIGARDVYDLSVIRTNNFVANGVFVHNSGKSWYCIHVGKQALLQKQRVVHVSLEMSEEEVLGRYYQSFFGIATRDDQFVKTTLELDDLGRLISFKSRRVRPRLDFGDPSIRKILRNKVKLWGARFGRLVIKAFPSGTLTVSQLKGYLDYLELTQKFIPTVLIVDYPDLFRIGTTDFRLALGRIFVELRGLAVERNLALVTPTQSGRSSIGAKRVSSTDVTEDISKVFTADTVLTYSQTDEEAKRGLARLTVEHARNAPKGTQVVISQSYATGAYVLSSAALSNDYWEGLESAAGGSVALDGEN